MVAIPLQVTCTPETLARYTECIVCAGSKHEILAAFDAFLCTSLNRPDCSVGTLLTEAKSYMDYSERDLVAASTYVWAVYLQGVAPGIDTSYAAMGSSVTPFTTRSEVEILAMQLWLLCQMNWGAIPGCDATTLLNTGRCFCVSIKELLAIRLYLIGVFANNFVTVNMDANILRQHVSQSIPGFASISALEAASTWLMCQLYDAAIENNQPT